MLTLDRTSAALSGPPPMPPDDRGPALRSERTALDAEIASVQDLLSREPDLELEAELGDAPARAALARCADAHAKLPKLQRRRSVVQRALDVLDRHQRAAMRAGELGYAESLRPEYRQALGALRAALDQAAQAHTRAWALAHEIEAAQSRADTLRLPSELSAPNPHPVPNEELLLGVAFTSTLGRDPWNKTKLQRWLDEADAVGISAASATGAKRGGR